MIKVGEKFIDETWDEHHKSDPGHSVKSLYSDHPSVQDEIDRKNEEERRKKAIKKRVAV